MLRMTHDQIEEFLTAKNEEYRREMSQFRDHHAEDYEDYDGYPDGVDLCGVYIDDYAETLSTIIERLDTLEKIVFPVEEEEKQAKWDKLMQRANCTPDNCADCAWNITCNDDYDTQPQVEETLPPDFWEDKGPLSTISITLENGSVAELNFSSLKEAMEFMEGMKFIY